MSEQAPATPDTQTPAPIKPRRRIWRWLVGGLGGLLLVLALALGGLGLWASSDGSLAAALRLAGKYVPLEASEVHGALLGGGTIGHLVWDQDGLRAEVEDAELRWQPRALLDRTVQIDHLSARRVSIDDQSEPGEPADGPPQSLALPVKIHADELRLDELHWAGPPAQTLRDVAGRFDYDGDRHLLQLDQARYQDADGNIQDGLFRARAAIGAHHPIDLDVALAGVLSTEAAGGETPLPLSILARVQGPLSDMQAQAGLRVTDDAAMPALPPVGAALATLDAASDDTPRAEATARITPWAAQPLPEARARLHALDVTAILADAPKTLLSGEFALSPLAGDAADGWDIVADLHNDIAGPWDQQQLPLQDVQADVSWQDGTAIIRTLTAQLGGGRLQASGQWHSAADVSTPGDAADHWQVDAELDNINPARLHTELAALPIDGTVSVQGQGENINFDLNVQARKNQLAPPSDSKQTAAAQALTRDLQALQLRDLVARGSWADGLLTVEGLRLRAGDAELTGSAQIRPTELEKIGGKARIDFTAPGITARVDGELQPTQGDGTLRLDITDAARALDWARQLPGASEALAGSGAKGQVTLDGRWQGGWRDPQLDARLTAPALSLMPPGSAADTKAIELKNIAATLAGKLAGARLTLQGLAQQGQRQARIDVVASGGRTTPDAPLAQSSWRAELAQLDAALRDPALDDGTWRLASRTALPLTWSPDRGGHLDVGAGSLVITSPEPTSEARLEWAPLQWRDGALTTTGRLLGLPLQWAERFASDQLAEAGVAGDIIFDGAWDVRLGRELRVNAEIKRASGDLTILATDGATGVQSRVAAGLRDAHVRLRSDGSDVQLQLVWDSERAGTAQGQLRTTLSSTRGESGSTQWRWPEEAPLQGELQAQLPQISTWSMLAPPGWRLGGSIATKLGIDGTRSEPQIHGSITADDMELRSIADGIQFERGRLRTRLDGMRVLIDEFTLHGAGDDGGQISARGEAGWIDDSAQARLDIKLDHLRPSIDPDLQLSVSGAVQAAFQDNTVSADGDLHVDQALIALPDESRPSLDNDVIVRGQDGRIAAGKDAPGTVARPTSTAAKKAAERQQRKHAARAEVDEKSESGHAQDADDPLTARINIGIDLGEAFRLQGMGIGTRLAGKLSLSADGPLTEMPELKGRVETVGGQFRAYSQQLNIERGRIRFSGDPSNPSLDVLALRPIYTSDQRVGVQVQGTALLPQVRLYSNPQLPDNQTLAWLMLGRAAPEDGAEAAMLQSAALAVLGGRDGGNLASSLGLDELSFGGGEGGDLSSTSVTLGKRLSDRLYTAYEHSLAGASGTLLIFYELSKRWTLRGQAGENSAVDLIFRLTFD